MDTKQAVAESDIPTVNPLSANHPENRRENSLTNPADRNQETKWRPDQGSPPLTEPQVTLAMQELCINSFVERFPAIDRRYTDLSVPMQKYGLFSFVPSKNAIPDKDGIYGWAKLRGNFDTDTEAAEQEERLIRQDSYHSIYVTWVGRPFPLTVDPKYTKTVKEVDIRKSMEESMTHNVKQKREKEAREMKEVHDREAALKADVEKGDVEDLDTYITNKVKLAQSVSMIVENTKTLNTIRDTIRRTRTHLEELDLKYPEFKTQFMEKYLGARKAAGIPDDAAQSGFMAYMASIPDDATLGL
jgi:hypothetical protein